MRTLRVPLLGTVILMLVASLSLSVAAQDEEPAPVAFVTGAVVEAYTHDASTVEGPSTSDVRGYELMTEQPGFVIHEIVDWSDPRLPTDLWLTIGYTLIWRGEDPNELDGAINHAWRGLLEDEHGRWVGTGRKVKDADETYSLYELTGEGTYEGLSALLHEVTPADAHGPWPRGFEGYIFEAELTPFPGAPVPVTTEGMQVYRSSVESGLERPDPSPSLSPEGAPQGVTGLMAPAAFTFTLKPKGEPTWGTERESEDGRTMEERGIRELHDMEAADPRASGVLTSVRNQNQLEIAGGGIQTQAFRMRLVNDGGEWAGTDHGLLAFTEGVFGAAGGVTVLTGDGGYEGLTLVLSIPWNLPGEAESSTAWGVIVPSDQMPPMPDPIEPPIE